MHRSTIEATGRGAEHGVIGFLLGLLLFVLRLCATTTSPCSPQVVSMEVVEPDDTILLNEALSCSGAGKFSVNWIGHVVVSQTVLVANSSVLVITGQGPNYSVVDGEGLVRLFEVDGASLQLNNVSVIQGLSRNAPCGLSTFRVRLLVRGQRRFCGR